MGIISNINNLPLEMQDIIWHYYKKQYIKIICNSIHKTVRRIPALNTIIYAPFALYPEQHVPTGYHTGFTDWYPISDTNIVYYKIY